MPREYVRLTQPLVRDRGRGDVSAFQPVTWDDALDCVASGFRAAVEHHGPTSFGIFSCSRSTNEMNFAAQKFARVVIGSNNVDSCNRT